MKNLCCSICRCLLAPCLLVVAVLNHPAQAAVSPKLNSVRHLGENVFALTGEFGRTCAKCEVIAEYGPAFRYAYRPELWQSHRIEVQVEDLNRSLDVMLRVVTPNGTSNSQRVQLHRKIIPPRELQQPVPDALLDTLHYFERQHHLDLGNKGEDSFDVSVSPPNCGEYAQVFEQARIVYAQQRFAQAQVVASPVAGCMKCGPVKVSWYNEPTGKLTYQLHVYRRLVSGVCTDQLRDYGATRQ